MINNDVTVVSAAKIVVTDIHIRSATAGDIDNIALLAQVVWVSTYAKDGISAFFAGMCRMCSAMAACCMN